MKELKLNPIKKISSVQEMVLYSAEKYGSKLALEDLNKTSISRVTYEELLENIKRFGNAIRSLGVNERSHIAIIGENRVQWAISFLTTMCFNYVAVPIDKNLNQNEIYNIIHESDAEVIIFSESYKELFESSHISLKKLKHFICMDEILEENSFIDMKKLIKGSEIIVNKELPKVNPDDLAEIIFTSGSLGRAKGVMLSQKNLATNLVDMLSMLMMYPEDRFLSVLPIHHTYECTCGMMCPLFAGSSIHFARSLKTVVDDIQKVKATILLGVPLLYDKMFKRISKAITEDKVKSKVVPVLVKATDLAQSFGLKDIKKKIFAEIHKKFGGYIRVFIAGGAAPDPLVAKGLREFGFNFLQGYGLTETSPILALNQLNNFKDDAAGIPLPSVQLKIVNKDQDGIGEVYAKGDNVMLGYYKNEKLTKDAFEDGWFKTGDLGYFDKDGFLHISGRMKNVIISKSGKNVFPEEIEDILNRSPFVLEALVYGEHDEKQGETIAVQIVVDAEMFIQISEKESIAIDENLIKKKIAEVVEETNKQLTSYKRIQKFYIRDNEFEKTTTQKIKRYLVKT